MKNLRIALLGLVMIAATAFTASAQTTKFTSYLGSSFTNGTTNATLINGLATLTNWTNPMSTTDPAFSGTPKLAALKIVAPAGVSHPDVDATSRQNFFNALKAYYINNGNVFDSPGNVFQITCVVSGTQRTYDVEIQTKN